MVLFVPSVERDGSTPIDQSRWVDASLEMLGRVFGGATAYPKAKGVWRDDDRGGALIRDEPMVVHCHTTPADIQDELPQPSALLGITPSFSFVEEPQTNGVAERFNRNYEPERPRQARQSRPPLAHPQGGC